MIMHSISVTPTNLPLFKFLDAERVVGHKPHVLDKLHIDVSWLEEEESGSTEDAGNVVDREGAARTPEPERTLTFYVSGFSPRTTEDTVRHYFENVRRSGGGEITELNYSTEECVAEITFLQVAGLCCGCLNQLKALYINFKPFVLHHRNVNSANIHGV